MLARLGSRLSYANVVATLALFVALGGGAYAATQINGRAISKNSIPGNRLNKHTVAGDRLRGDSVTGAQVKESTLGQVPSAATAANALSAASAAEATSADTAGTLAGQSVSDFGAGIVSGSLSKVPNGTSLVQPYGYFAFGSADFTSVEATAPVKITVRDFVADFAGGTSGSVTFSMSVDVNGTTSDVPLCQVSTTTPTCHAAGGFTIPSDATYRVKTVGSGNSANVSVGYQYRAAAG